MGQYLPGDPGRQQELEHQDGGETIAEPLMKGLVVKDLHSQQSSHAAAQSCQQKERFFRHPADGLVFCLALGLPLVQAEHQEGRGVHGDQPDPQQGPEIAQYHKAGDRGALRQKQTLFHGSSPSKKRTGRVSGQSSVAENSVP